MALIVLVGIRTPGSRDDHDPAHQRPGFLVSPGNARRVPQLALPGDPVGRVPVLVVFDRTVPGIERYADALAGVPHSVEVVLVVPRPPPVARSRLARGSLVVDPSRRVAGAVGMRGPRDGGPPIGYAAIDAEARVRYATLDPAYLDHRDENAVIAEAIS